MTLAARIEGIGLVGPGLAGWDASRAVLAGRAPLERTRTTVPAPDALPATERRRAGIAVRLALAAGLAAVRDAGREAGECAAVFASSDGETENCHAICEALASEDRLISPTRFHNSVHNAPSGYWGIATGATQAADCLGAFDGSAACGLLEALARVANDPARPVLLVAYDYPYPHPLDAARPIGDAFAAGLVLCGGEGRGVHLNAALRGGSAPPMEGDIERVRAGIPAARLLPLLACVARGGGKTSLEYLDDLSLDVEVRA